jgi:hypothetical protein
MTAFLTGWSGPALAVSVGSLRSSPRAMAAAPWHDEVSCSVQREQDGRIALTASVADVIVRKTVSRDGRAAVTVKRDNDVVSIVSARATVVVWRGPDSVLVNVAGGHDAQLSRVRQLLLGSTAIRGLRTLATVLDESGAQSLEKLGLRFTGALVAQLEGEEGAVRRLSRELQTSYGGSRGREARPDPVGAGARGVSKDRAMSSPNGPAPTMSKGAADCWHSYRASVVKVANALEVSLSPFSFINPMRLVCSFVFLTQVEGLWFTYLSEFAGLLR